MSKLKKTMKKLEEQRKEFQELIRKEQATCPHVKKNGKSRLGEPFMADGVKKAICNRCGATVIIDDELLSKDSVIMSTAVIKSALSELKARAHTGSIKVDDNLLKTVSDFESKVLDDLPEFMSSVTGDDGGKKKKKKKDKKKHKKFQNQRSRWG